MDIKTSKDRLLDAKLSICLYYIDKYKILKSKGTGTINIVKGKGWGVASSPSHVPQRVHPLHFVSSNALMSCLRMDVLKCLSEGRLPALCVSLFHILAPMYLSECLPNVTVLNLGMTNCCS